MSQLSQPPTAGAAPGETVPEPPGGSPSSGLRTAHAKEWNSPVGFAVKLALMAMVNAFGVYLVWAAYVERSWGILIGSALLVLAADLIYFSRRTLPLKYIAPGLVFLIVFQLFTMVYTGYVAFTNYGTGHNATKAQAVDALLIQDERRAPESPSYPLTVLESDGELAFAIADDGVARVGTTQTPLATEPDATITEDRVTAVPGWDVVERARILSELQAEVVALRVPVSDEATDGSIRTRDGTTGAIYTSVLVWDADADTMTNTETGVTYRPNDRGQFQATDGSVLPVGWRVGVGLENFTTAFTDVNYSGPFVKILAWTFSFAVLTVLTSFGFGLVLSAIFDDSRIRGRKVWRTLFILPYAFPAFLSALLWRGMLNSNPDYGIINQVFFFGARVEWLTDPWLAKLAILGVNLWLSFPYWLLVCTGALQSLPADVTEAATLDGAGRVRMWRAVLLPLLLISTAPLLIASFAFSFNNFTLIYMLTGGGPRFTDTTAVLGHTDILITMVYQISGVAGGRADFGLASALSIIIFLIVGGISIVAFRQTRRLEEIM